MAVQVGYCGRCGAALTPGLPEFLGGSADLTPSNNTQFKTAVTITPEDFKGNYLQ